MHLRCVKSTPHDSSLLLTRVFRAWHHTKFPVADLQNRLSQTSNKLLAFYVKAQVRKRVYSSPSPISLSPQLESAGRQVVADGETSYPYSELAQGQAPP